MKEEPAPISTVSPMAPPALDRVVKRCLAKDPEERWQNAADLKSRAEVDRRGRLAVGNRRARRGVSAAKRRALVDPVAAAVVAARDRRSLRPGRCSGPRRRRVLRASIDLPPRMELRSAEHVAGPVAGRNDARDRRERTGREESSSGCAGWTASPCSRFPGTDDASCPFWSPDSRFIGFFAAAKLKKVPASGGTVQTICDAPDGRGASWGDRGSHRVRARSLRRSLESPRRRGQPDGR